MNRDRLRADQGDSLRTHPAEVRHYAYLDALRGVAFLGVMAVHTSAHVPGLPAWLRDLCKLGNYGVQLFFVLSALTLCMSMQSRSRVEDQPIRAFWVRRFFRIAPMYWVAILFYVGFNGMGPSHFAPAGIGLLQILTNATFLHGWRPDTINSVVPGGWSIAVEMNFYLVFPVLFLQLRDLRRAMIAVLICAPLSILISVATARILKHFSSPSLYGLIRDFTYYWLPRQFVIFLIGICLFHLMRSQNRLIQRFGQGGDPRILLVATVALLACILLSSWLPDLYLVISVVLALAVLGLSIYPTRLVVNRLLRHTGLVSYSAYLTHFAVIGLVARGFGGVLQSAGTSAVLRFGIYYVICWGATLVVATASYRLIEEPFRAFGARIIRAARPRREEA